MCVTNKELGLPETATVLERAGALARYYEERGALPKQPTKEVPNGNGQ